MLSLQGAIDLLKAHQLFEEVIINQQRHYDLSDSLQDQPINQLTYDSRQVEAQALFICKGLHFNTQYLIDAIHKGAVAILSGQEQVEIVKAQQLRALQIVVNDVQKAMAVLARGFYGNPDEQLTMIGYTGTKGKTTSVYFTRHILQAQYGANVAQLSSIDNCLNGTDFVESHLTTPESLDLFRMLREAVDHGMKYLVMEVSSQAYKKSRVYGLQFDYGVFLNISPDHISPVEHPNFDDYLYCKSQIIEHSKQIIISREIAAYDLLIEKAREKDVPLISFGVRLGCDYQYQAEEHGYFKVKTNRNPLPRLDGQYRVMVPGNFNYANALSAMIVAAQLKIKPATIKQGLLETVVPGRMEMMNSPNGIIACVDYAHNYLSLTASFAFLKHEYPQGRLIVVVGSVGNKAESRRSGIAKALMEYADIAILTSDDTYGEDQQKVIQEIHSYLSGPKPVEVLEILDREAAVRQAFALAQPQDVVFLAAKGREQYLRVASGNQPYFGDYQLAQELTK